MSIYSVVISKPVDSLTKHWQRNVKPFSQPSALLSQSTVKKQYVVHWQTL